MRPSRWVKSLFVLWVVGFLVVIGVAFGTTVWLVERILSRDKVVGGEFDSNRIAFVGNDGNLWLAAPGKEELLYVTTDGRGYRFPTWSPDGDRLAFIGPDDEGHMTLFVSSGTQYRPAVLFNSPDSAPFYIYWSPDSRSVAFLTQEASNLAMRLADVENPGAVRTMAEGAPFYWAWAPNGDQLFMHVGGARAFSRDAHLSFLENKAGAARVELGLAPGQFQAPMWSANGQHVFYIATDDSGAEAIFRTDVQTSEQMLVTPLGGPAQMVLSPTDAHIAYLELHSVDQFPATGTVYVVDAAGKDERKVVAESVAAIYWSPDGKKLALLTPSGLDEDQASRAPGRAAPSSLQSRFRWWIYDVESETMQLLASFGPTSQFLETVPYFDQYHLSLTFWSPDSRYFLITESDVGFQDGTVWMYDVTGNEPPRQIGEGVLAVWSWQ